MEVNLFFGSNYGDKCHINSLKKETEIVVPLKTG